MYATDSDKKLKRLSWCLQALGMLTAVSILAAAEFVVLRPIDAQIGDCRQRVAESQTFLKDRSSLKAEHRELEEELKLANQEADALQTRIPSEPREAEFLGQVTRLAKEGDLKIKDYRRGQVVKRSSYSTLKVDLICESSYAATCRFLERLRSLPRLEIDATDWQSYSVEISVTLFFAPRTAGDPNKKGASNG